MTTVNANRRAFIKMTAGAFVLAPFVVAPKVLYAQYVAEEEQEEKKENQKEKVALDSSTALALGYTENSSDVDGSKYPTHTKEQVCRGCILYQGDDPDWGACNTFAGRLVAGQGWCQAYWAKTT